MEGPYQPICWERQVGGRDQEARAIVTHTCLERPE